VELAAVLAVFAMAATASLLDSTPQSSSDGALEPALGLFVGSQAPADVLALGKQLDVSPTIDTVYAGGSDYNSYSPPSGIPAGMTLMLGVGALTPSQATSIGDNLVAGGQSHAIIRVMWEQNQDEDGWFQGWNQLTYPTASSYIAEFQSIVTTMRAVPGQAFSFMWNPNGGTGSEASGRTWQDTWPGSSYVNIVGVDQYDYSGYAANIGAVVSFAKSQGLPVAIPEWGLNGSDDPSYINGVAAIVNNPANDVLLQAYFSYPGSIDSDITQFPQSEAAYEADFQGAATSIPAPTTTTTTTTTGPAPTTTTTGPAPTTTTTGPAPTTTTTTSTTDPSPTTTLPAESDLVPTVTALQIVPDPGTSGEEITASVTPVPDGGTVRFSVDRQVIGSQPVSTSDGTASVEFTMPVGTHSIGARFSGDAGFGPSRGRLRYAVNQAPTSLVVASPAQVADSSEFVLQATLTSEGAPVSDGVVWFAADGNELCQGTTDASGQISCNAEGQSSSPAVSSTDLTATFEGDSAHLPVVAHVTAAPSTHVPSGAHRYHAGAVGSGNGSGGANGGQMSTSVGGGSGAAGTSTQPEASAPSISAQGTEIALSARHGQPGRSIDLAVPLGVLGVALMGYGLSEWWSRRRRNLDSSPN
jgi:hypothetical protein